MTVLRTELDALLERVREDKADTTGENRNTVAYDCWRMFEDLAGQFKEESAMRDRYKRQSNAWRDKALELADETHIAKLVKESECPVCRGASILQPCQECHGSKLISVAYDTLRIHYKRSEEVNNALLEAVKDALAFLDRPDITTYEWYKLAPDHVGKFRRAIAKAEDSK